jgi:hypothetical protein
MRFWLSGPRILGIRPGISFRPDELLRKPSPRRQLQGSFIYVIRGDHGLLKIGISSNPSARLAQLQTASAVPLAIAYVGALRCSGYAVEAEAHRTLAPYRAAGYRYSPSNKAIMRRCSADVFVSLGGEWFDCPVDMAVAAIAAAAYRLGETITSGDPKLANEVVRIAAAEAATGPGLLSRIVLAIIKGIIGIILAGEIWASGWVIYILVTTPRTNAF